MADQTITPEEAEFNALIAEGRRLNAVASAGPWEADGSEIYRANAYDEDTGARVWVGETCNPDEHALSTDNADLIVWTRNNLPGLLDRLESGQVFGKAMLSTLNVQSDIALQATGLHHLIEPDGDGDWQAVWETVAELGEQVQRVTALAEKWESAVDLVTEQPSLVANAFAAEIRAALAGGRRG